MKRSEVLPRKLHFPSPYKHQHPPVENINEVFEEQLGQSQQARTRRIRDRNDKGQLFQIWA